MYVFKRDDVEKGKERSCLVGKLAGCPALEDGGRRNVPRWLVAAVCRGI